MSRPILKLKAQIQDNNKTIARLTSENNNLNSEVSFLRVANADLQKYNDSNNAISKNFVSSLNEYKLHNETLQSQVTSLTQQLSEKTNKPLIMRLRNKVKELTIQNETKDNEITQLNLSRDTTLQSAPAVPELQIDMITPPTDVEQLKLELDNVNGILNETHNQVEQLQNSNIKLQLEMNKKSVPVPLGPRVKLQEEIHRLRKVINTKNSLINEHNKTIDELKKAVPKVAVHIDGMTAQELKHVPLRRKVFELVNKANSHVKEDNKSMIHVHLDDDTIVDIHDETIKAKLEEMIKHHNNNPGHANNESSIQVHLYDESIVNLSDTQLKKKLEKLFDDSEKSMNHINNNSSLINVHLDDTTMIELSDKDIKNRLEALITNSESIVYDTKKMVNDLELKTIPQGKLTINNSSAHNQGQSNDQDNDQDYDEYDGDADDDIDYDNDQD
jgi:myosin heavy subunit